MMLARHIQSKSYTVPRLGAVICMEEPLTPEQLSKVEEGLRHVQNFHTQLHPALLFKRVDVDTQGTAV